MANKKGNKRRHRHPRSGNPNWVKGVSGSPTTQWTHERRPPPRPLTLRKYVKELTNNGQEVADFMAAILRFDFRYLVGCAVAHGMPLELIARFNIRIEDAMRAAEWLANRGNGSVAQTLEHKTHPDEVPVNATGLNPGLLPLDKRKQLLDLLREMRDAQAQAPPVVIDEDQVRALRSGVA